MGLFGSSKKSTGIFVPLGKGFRELTDHIDNKSVNGIAEHLGYASHQVHSFTGRWNKDNAIQCAVFKMFTQDVLFVITLDTVIELTRSAFDKFMEQFRYDEVYDRVNVQYALTDGITNANLTLDFLANVLEFDSNELGGGGIILSKKLNLYLYFSNGFLVDFSSGDGWNEWAKFFNDINPQTFKTYVTTAESIWGKDTRQVQRWVNTLSEAMANTPEGFKNAFASKHRDSSGIINFRMLLVCHYSQPILLDEFKFITRGQVTQASSDRDIRYWYRNFLVTFDDAGDLVEILENPNH